MKQSDTFEFVDAGSLARPGPIGRWIRFALGALCLYALWEIVRHAGITSTQPFSTLDNRVVLLLAPLWIFNYVVNIGFARSWGHRPLIASLIFLSLSAFAGMLISGSFDSPIFGIPLNLWLAYFYSHLGASFVLAAAIATPGCEMRSIPELFGRIRGRPSKEHHCPATFINRTDAWESDRMSN